MGTKERPDLSSPRGATRIHFVDASDECEPAARWLAQAKRRLQRPLRTQGFEVSSSAEVLAEAVNLAAPASLAHWLWPYYKSYVIGLRCDLRAVAQCDAEIVPLHLDPSARHRTPLPQWPNQERQRDSLRRSRVENVLVLTPLGSSDSWLAQGELERALRLRNMRLHVCAGDLADLSEIDIVLADCAALRAWSRPYLSPLVTAWRAGVPALLVETAIERGQRQAALDYMAVASVSEIVAALAQLRSHPQLYEAMQRHGQALGRSYDDAAVTALWLRCLRDRLVPEALTTLAARQRHPLASMAVQARRWVLQQSSRRAAR